MIIIIVYILIMTIIIGNCIYSIETSAFYAAKSALNNALVELSIDNHNIIDNLSFEINPDTFMILVSNQLKTNYQYLDLELFFYFYNQSTGDDCMANLVICDGVQIKLVSTNSHFYHQAEIRFEVSVGG